MMSCDTLSTPLDSAVFIVYDVFILVFMIMISQRKKISKTLQNSAVFLLYGIHVKQNEINLRLFCSRLKCALLFIG